MQELPDDDGESHSIRARLADTGRFLKTREALVLTIAFAVFWVFSYVMYTLYPDNMFIGGTLATCYAIVTTYILHLLIWEWLPL